MDVQVTLERVSSATPAARMLVEELELVLSAEYPPEQRHGLAIDAIFQPFIHFYVASLEGEPVGCGAVALLDGFAELKRMYVRPAMRGTGVAVALVGRLAAVAAAAGYRVLRLETGDAQHAALRFYAREGFVRCGVFGPYVAMAPETIETSVFMEKPLQTDHDDGRIRDYGAEPVRLKRKPVAPSVE